jgi:hypothetical protein
VKAGRFAGEYQRYRGLAEAWRLWMRREAAVTLRCPCCALGGSLARKTGKREKEGFALEKTTTGCGKRLAPLNSGKQAEYQG